MANPNIEEILRRARIRHAENAKKYPGRPDDAAMLAYNRKNFPTAVDFRSNGNWYDRQGNVVGHSRNEDEMIEPPSSPRSNVPLWTRQRAQQRPQPQPQRQRAAAPQLPQRPQMGEQMQLPGMMARRPQQPQMGRGGMMGRMPQFGGGQMPQFGGAPMPPGGGMQGGGADQMAMLRMLLARLGIGQGGNDQMQLPGMPPQGPGGVPAQPWSQPWTGTQGPAY